VRQINKALIKMPAIEKLKNTNPHRPFALRVMRFVFSTIGPLLPNYFGKLAYEFWFSTQRYKTPEKELPARESAKTSIMDVYGLPVQIYQWGDNNAPKILFAHGWSGRGTQCAFFIEPLVLSGFQVISFDGPAHGETPGKQTSILQFADVILQLDEEYGPFDAALTHSFGGMLLTYAMTLGMNIKRIVCICPPDHFDTIFTGFQRTLDIPDSVMRVVNTRFYATHGHHIREAVSPVMTVKNLPSQALIIHDEDDTEVPLTCGEKVANAWPNAKFIKTKGLGHRRIMRDKAVIKSTLEFLSQ
jgi:pimeloyl-ACP methyl ester carboxylesterase